jgi:hypothetical protein
MKRLVPVAVLGLVAWLGSMGQARATMPIQKQAKASGAAAANCLACHVDKLPKKEKDAHALNDKGKWLVAEKDKRKAKEVDATWLKDYVETK